MGFFAIGFPMLLTPMNSTGVLEAIDLEHTTARLATAGSCWRLQYRRPEAAARSPKEAAMLPPPCLPTVTSTAPGSPTDCQGAWYGGRLYWYFCVVEELKFREKK